tara:strand:+ start:5501 stop:6142 length:642 start_codon:yes stop_codon:yes gene_type:complete
MKLKDFNNDQLIYVIEKLVEKISELSDNSGQEGGASPRSFTSTQIEQFLIDKGHDSQLKFNKNIVTTLIIFPNSAHAINFKYKGVTNFKQAIYYFPLQVKNIKFFEELHVVPMRQEYHTTNDTFYLQRKDNGELNYMKEFWINSEYLRITYDSDFVKIQLISPQNTKKKAEQSQINKILKEVTCFHTTKSVYFKRGLFSTNPTTDTIFHGMQK